MKTKILIVLVITIVLGGGGFFIWKNSFLTKIEKPEVKEEIKKEIGIPPAVEEKLEEIEVSEEVPTLTEIKFEWKKEEGIRISDGNAPYILGIIQKERFKLMPSV